MMMMMMQRRWNLMHIRTPLPLLQLSSSTMLHYELSLCVDGCEIATGLVVDECSMFTKIDEEMRVHCSYKCGI